MDETEKSMVTGEKVFDCVTIVHDRLRKLEATISILPELKDMLSTVSAAQTLMASSAQSMAETFQKAEERYARMEQRHEALAELATGKDQIPLKSHYWTLFAALVPTMVMAVGVVVGVLYFTKYDINASLTNLELGQHTTQQLIQDKTEKK